MGGCDQRIIKDGQLEDLDGIAIGIPISFDTDIGADFDFFGGAAEHSHGSVLGAQRLRTASARLDWPRTSLAIGYMF
jgi:hypothetical protein